MRKELVLYLEELADPSSYLYRNANLDDAVHFLFDDTDLHKDPHRYVGVFLRNTIEAVTVRRVPDAIHDVLGKYGVDLADADYVKVPEWAAVARAAQDALSVLATPDEELSG